MDPINREQFMTYFRSDKFSEELSADDRLEIFLTSLPGSSDITSETIHAVCAEFNEECPCCTNPTQKQLYIAIQAVTQYLWRDEEKHYETEEDEGKENHIYNHLCFFNDWLKNNQSNK